MDSPFGRLLLGAIYVEKDIKIIIIDFWEIWNAYIIEFPKI